MDKNVQRRSQKLTRKIDAKQQEAQAKAKLLRERLKQDYSAVASTASGRAVLRHIKEISNFGRTKIAGNMETRTIDPMTTTVNAAMENVYLKIRAYLRPEHLRRIENQSKEI